MGILIIRGKERGFSKRGREEIVREVGGELGNIMLE